MNECEWLKVWVVYEMMFVGWSVLDVDYLDEGIWVGFLELKLMVLCVGKLVVILFFVFFWNGIVLVFLVNIVGDVMWGGLIMWVFLLFFLFFVGVGFFMIGLLVWIVMVLVNLVLWLMVNWWVFVLGEMVELVWWFDGSLM